MNDSSSWGFVQVTDPHLGSYTDGRWNNAFICTMMPDVMRCLRSDLVDLQPEFILATGDLASQPTRDAMFAARDLLDWLGFPYYPMGGNHDFVVEESRDWFLQAFKAHLPAQSLHYSFDHRNLHIVVLDPWWRWSDGQLMGYSEQGRMDIDVAADQARPIWVLPDEQMAWLESDLTVHSDIPTIVACHYPAVDIPERMARPGLRDAGRLENGPEVIELLGKHPQVKAVFSGHYHMNLIVEENGVTHVITSALPEYPSEYRETRVFEDRIEVHSKGLSDPSFAARSLIPGHGWTAGQTCDRQVTIPLI